MSAALPEKLARALPGEHIVRVQALATSAFQQTYRISLADGRDAFVKTSDRQPHALYPSEARGLAWLADARAVRVPGVLAVTADVLVLAWIETGARGRDFDANFGHALAALHRAGAPNFGHAEDNFVGTLAQENSVCASFPAFYRERRLRPLVLRAHTLGHLTTAHVVQFEALYARLDELCGEPETPARLHGDLWSGNVMCDGAGAPVLVDPAVYGGQRELDLAMLQLFGGPSLRFFSAYDAVWPRGYGHAERVSLFQLYPLLVHVCLFGAGYVTSLLDALRRYVR